jgi:hypothetical protein
MEGVQNHNRTTWASEAPSACRSAASAVGLVQQIFSRITARPNGRRGAAYYRASSGSIGACSVRDEIHRDPVNAVAQMARWRAIVKDVPKMAAAVRAMNLGSDHAEGSIS